MADPWRWWSSETIARITGCPEDAVTHNWPLIVDALEGRGIYDRDVCLGVLPTVSIETASQFAPVEEAFWLSDDWRRANLRYYPFFGRGYIQITWEENYRDAGAALGVDLVGNPALALDPTVSARVFAWFWATKGVRAKDGSRFYTLVDLCHEHDYEWIRRSVQGGTDGLDRLIAMASALDAYDAPSEEPIMPAYNLDIPIQTQNHDWDCAEQSTLWAVTAAGRHPDDAWMEQAMLSGGIESTDLGLLVGDGSRLAAWITEQYSDGSPVLRAHNASSVSFDDVKSVAGSSPVLLGGHNWGGAGHWTGVRGYDAAQDALVLANPGGTGPVYGWQTMSRQQFASISPCSMVVITADGIDASPTSPTPIPAADMRDAQIAALNDRVSGLEIAVAHLADILAGDRLQGIQEEARAIREQFLGKRPAA